MVNHVLRLSFLGFILMLNGCSQSILDTTDARCPFTERGGCQSMERVNQMVTEKRYTPDGLFVQQAPIETNHSRAQSTFQK